MARRLNRVSPQWMRRLRWRKTPHGPSIGLVSGEGLRRCWDRRPTSPKPAGHRARRRRAPIEFLRPNPRNPRKRFDAEELDELAASIKERGVIQPILVRAIPRVADAYEIIAGERRWRAAQRAGQHDIPIIVLEAGDREALEIAIIENVQRDRSQRARRGRGLRSARRRSRIFARRYRADGRQEPQPCRQHPAPDQSARAYQGAAGSRPDFCRPRARPARGAEPDATADRIVAEGLTVRDIERIGENAGATTRREGEAAGHGCRHARARGEARSRAGGEGDDPPHRRERRHPNCFPQFRAARRFLPPPLPAGPAVDSPLLRLKRGCSSWPRPVRSSTAL